jgi:hypothetical protein
MRGGQLINLPSKRPEVAAHHPILYLTGDERGVIVVDAREGRTLHLGSLTRASMAANSGGNSMSLSLSLSLSCRQPLVSIFANTRFPFAPSARGSLARFAWS